MSLFESLTQRVLSEEAKLQHGAICPTMDVVLLTNPSGEILKLWRVAGEAGNVWTKDRNSSNSAPAETFSWSPDGQLLAVTSRSSDGEEGEEACPVELEICSVNDCKLVLPKTPIEAAVATDSINSNSSDGQIKKRKKAYTAMLQWLQLPEVPQRKIQAQELIRRLPALGAIVNRSAADSTSNPASMCVM